MNGRELLVYLCDGLDHDATVTLEHRLSESRRLQGFAARYPSKIRKKLRTAEACGTLKSLFLELDVARLFVEDRHCTVEYERYGQGRLRSPDLTVTYRTRTDVHIEVTHIQDPPGEVGDWERKLISVVCHKLAQAVADGINVLVIASASGTMTAEDVARAMKRLKERVEKRETDLLTRYGFVDTAGFFKQFQWLSAVAVWRARGPGERKGEAVWMNPQARRPLPQAIQAILAREE